MFEVIMPIIFLIAVYVPAFFVVSLIFSISKFKKFIKDEETIAALIVLTIVLFDAILIIYYLSNGNFAEYGFRACGIDYLAYSIIIGFIFGFSLMGIVTRFLKTPLFEEISWLKRILVFWIYASTVEEIVFRGLILGYLYNTIGIGDELWLLDFPIIYSAALFALVHLSLIKRGAKKPEIVIIVLMGFILGLLAGLQVKITGSIIPAIIIHGMFNVAGSIIPAFAIIYSIFDLK